MATDRFNNILTQVVRELTAPESCKELFHQHCDDTPLPSLATLEEIVRLCRAILFPGYFGYSHVTGHTIGNHVKLYQGVTLGAKSFPLDAQGNPIKGIERHPILEDNVIVYSNSTILGRITIGHDAIIGGNVWVTEDVPAGTKVLQQRKAN